MGTESLLGSPWTSRVFVPLGALVAAALVGALVALNYQLAFLAVVFVLCAGALAVPAGYWAIAALIAAVTFRGLVGVGALPSVATYLDIPLVWGALVAALLRTRLGQARPRWARRNLRWLGALALAMLVSWAFSSAELLRPIAYFVLLAEPFALVIALVLDPPSGHLRHLFGRVLLALIIVQIPLAFWQAAVLGTRDPVQGTLYGAGAGAHTMSAVVVVGAIWIGVNTRYPLLWRCVAVGFLALIPFLADAKQVIFVLPAILVVGRWSTPKDVFLRTTAAVAAVAALVLFIPRRTYLGELFQRGAGQGTEARKRLLRSFGMRRGTIRRPLSSGKGRPRR